MINKSWLDFPIIFSFSNVEEKKILWSSRYYHLGQIFQKDWKCWRNVRDVSIKERVRFRQLHLEHKINGFIFRHPANRRVIFEMNCHESNLICSFGQVILSSLKWNRKTKELKFNKKKLPDSLMSCSNRTISSFILFDAKIRRSEMKIEMSCLKLSFKIEKTRLKIEAA